MMDWINSIIQGVLLGGYYSLIACGLAFMFQVMGIINLAHGTLAILAGFAIWTVSDRFGVSPFVALIGVLPAMAAVGWILQRGILERSARAGQLVPLLATFGLAIVIENLLFKDSAPTRVRSRPISTRSPMIAGRSATSTSASYRCLSSSSPWRCSAVSACFFPIRIWAARSAPPPRTPAPLG